MISMANPPEVKTPESACAPCAYEESKYPYGLCLSLDTETMAKLGLSDLVSVGTEMMITAKVKVTSVGSHESAGEGVRKNMELQITDMEIGQGARSSEDMAKTMYPGMA